MANLIGMQTAEATVTEGEEEPKSSNARTDRENYPTQTELYLDRRIDALPLLLLYC